MSVPSRAVGSRATYSCNTGYTLRVVPVCLMGHGVDLFQYVVVVSESLSSYEMICTTNFLHSAMSYPTNGDVSLSSRSPGGIATYSCNSGYALSNWQRRFCLSNGVWSG